jgi:nucleoside-diphosphate-sugar epimerase
MRTDLVTGATGFIGRHLAQRILGQGRGVRLLCREKSVSKLPSGLHSRAEVVIGDLRDLGSIAKAVVGVDRVFHCAGHVSDWGAPEDFYSVNVGGTHALLEASVRTKIARFVHLSSIAVFGVPPPAYFDDDTPYGASKDLYSKTKIEAEKLALQFHREKNLPVTVLRPAVVYGPDSTWVEEPLRMIRRNRMFLIGGGAGTCHPCYIENLLDAILLVAENPSAVGQAFSIADDEPISFREYFNHLAAIAGKPPIAHSIPMPIARTMASACEAAARLLRCSTRPLLTHTAIDLIGTSSRMSVQKIKRELGFQPRFSVARAMENLKSRIPSSF